MSRGLSTYLVDLRKLKRSCGGSSSKLGPALEAKFATRIEDLERRNRANGRPAVRQALKKLVSGQRLQRTHAPVAAGVLELVASHCGSFLPNHAWYPCDTRFIRGLDRAMRSAEISVSISELLFNGSPIAIPLPSSGCPAVGHLDARAAAALRRQLRGRSVADVDPRQAAALRQFTGWLDRAAQTRMGLVFFYY
ncbi:MAG: hypothetical protein H6707_11790 [Deltaproteobacteria bacterium]|nr:hypothetical protein [Deltaproteobacteria bacterium]